MQGHTRSAVVLTACIVASQAQAGVIINEVDYDQPGADTAEFIELFNSSGQTVALNGFSLELINGTSSASYRSIDLSGFSMQQGAYLVVCTDAALVLNCDHVFAGTSSWLQNGAPDGIALLDGNEVVDAVTYEGQITGYTEGGALLLADSNSVIMSLARLPDGGDSDNNFSDFGSACITPGTMNIAGSGDCSMLSVTPVPVPAAVWLFASGLLGLAGVARGNGAIV